MQEQSVLVPVSVIGVLLFDLYYFEMWSNVVLLFAPLCLRCSTIPDLPHTSFPDLPPTSSLHDIQVLSP